MLRSVRFGTTSAQGRAAAVQLSLFMEDGAILRLANGRVQVNFRKLEESVEALVEKFVVLQHGGDKAAVDRSVTDGGEIRE